MILLLVSASLAASAAPVVLWVSEPVKPGETVVAYGSGFDGCKAIHWTRLADTTHAAISGTVPPAQIGQRSVKFVLPDNVPQGVYQAQLITPAGNETVSIDRPRVCWTQGDLGGEGTPGGFVRIVGRCLQWNGSKPSVRIKANGIERTLTVSSAQPFSLQAALPAALSPGDYEVYVSSGYGGASGWSKPGLLKVVAPVHGVEIVYDAPPPVTEPSANNTRLQSVLNDAGKTGGIVKLGAGKWLLNGTLSIPKGVTLSGTGMTTTELEWVDAETSLSTLISASDHFGVNSLTMVAKNSIDGIEADQATPSAGYASIHDVRMRLNPYAGHMGYLADAKQERYTKRFIETHRLSWWGCICLSLGGHDVDVHGCDIHGAGGAISLQHGSGGWIYDNHFYNGREGFDTLSSCDGVIFQNNEIVGCELDSGGTGINRLQQNSKTHQPWNYAKDVYYANNTIKMGFGGDPCGVGTDGGGGVYWGKIDASTDNSVTLASDIQSKACDCTGTTVFVIDGTGQGEYRTVTAIDGRTVTVDKPWQIPLDSSSVVSITALQTDYIIYANHFEDTGVAIAFYGTAIDCIAFGNTGTLTEGIEGNGLNYGSNAAASLQPEWYIQCIENKLTSPYWRNDIDSYGIALPTGEVVNGGVIVQGQRSRGKILVPTSLCCVIRNNEIHGGMIKVGASDYAYPTTQDDLIEHNSVFDSPIGCYICESTQDVYQRDNHFVNCKRDVVKGNDIQRAQEEKLHDLSLFPDPVLQIGIKGDLLVDTSKNAINLYLSGSVQPRRTPCGDGFALDGASYVSIADHLDQLALNTFTISLWVKPNTVTGIIPILSNRLSHGTEPYSIGLKNGAAIANGCSDTNGWWGVGSSSAPDAQIQPGCWTHILLTSGLNSKLSLYLNGKLVSQCDTVLPLAHLYDQPLFIGQDPYWTSHPGEHPHDISASTQTGLCGEIAGFKIWARELSRGEIKALDVSAEANSSVSEIRNVNR